MKKIMISILISLVIILSMTSIVSAVTTDELLDYLRTQGGSYITESDIVRIERYFKEYPISEEQADQLKTKIDEAKAVVDAVGGDLRNLTSADKDKLKGIANEVATIIDINLVFKKNSVDIYKNGKLIETASLEGNQILVYTGNESNKNVLLISGVAILVLATGTILVRKSLKSAE